MKISNIHSLMTKIQTVFVDNFGLTPLRQRNQDILTEAIEISRFSSTANLKEEHGDLLCSLLMSFKENGWDPVECIEATLNKIERRKSQYQAYGRKLSIAILGGAFDPITVGHVAVAEFLLNVSSQFDEVWVTPCYKHLYNKKMASAEYRLELCRLATKHDRRIKVWDYEIKHKLGGETYNLVKRLLSDKEYYDKYSFSIVIGMDNANTAFDKWMNFEDLERLIPFVVVTRSGIDIKHESNWYLKSPHKFLVPEKPLPEVSSTIVKEDISLHYLFDSETVKDRLKNNLNPEVFDSIIKNGAYNNVRDL
jgi:nicotinate-nucleotide adenylyltransferase